MHGLHKHVHRLCTDTGGMNAGAHANVHTHACMHVHTHACAHMHTCTHAHTPTCTHECTHEHTRMQECMHTYTHMHTRMHLSVCNLKSTYKLKFALSLPTFQHSRSGEDTQ